jgi:hypothetical protein
VHAIVILIEIVMISRITAKYNGYYNARPGVFFILQFIA